MGPTLVSAWKTAGRALEAAGVDAPVQDARWLLEKAAGVKRLDILTDPHRPVSEEAQGALTELVARRAAREPLAYILGRTGFWTLDLKVDARALTPRADTETLVKAGLSLIAERKMPRILELGVGTGAVILALLSERPDAFGVGVDVSPEALALAEENRDGLGLSARLALQLGDWGDGLDEPFDLIVSNPPYIPSTDIDGLEPEVARFEPRLALDGGADGLFAYRRLAPHAARLLIPGGGLALEVGKGQAPAVSALMASYPFTIEAPMPDLTGVERVVFGRRQ